MISLLFAAVEHLSDSELVRGLREGDTSAFRKLFDRYHGPLYRYLVRRGLPEAIAEDILQDAFMAVWERREQIDPARSLRGYLYKTCHNRAVNHYRDHRKFAIGHDQPELAIVPAQDSDLFLSELNDALDKAVAALPERRRAVFEMCFINGLTYREAAEALRISVKTVENQMGHALKTIRSSIEHLL